MSLRESDKCCSVTNANFDRVLSVVNNYLQRALIPGCTCEKCVSSIIAGALNSLPTHYYVDKQEQDVGSPWVLVERAVDEAIERHQEELYSRERTSV